MMDFFSKWFTSVWPNMGESDWRDPLELLMTNVTKNDKKKKPIYAVMILNHFLDSPTLRYSEQLKNKSVFDDARFRHFIELWNNANVRHAVDGANNYLFELQRTAKSVAKTNRHPNLELHNPHLISGDFDSIRPDVLAHYKTIAKTGIEVIETPDQDHTDFEKAIDILAQHERLKRGHESENGNVTSIVVFYTTCGRLDHVLSIFHTLYKLHKTPGNGESGDGHCPPIMLVDLGSSITFLLTKGKHLIPCIRSAKWCSLVPLSGSVVLTTTGFRWNLNNDTLQYGKFISTSQEFDGHSDVATIEILSGDPLLFSVDFEQTQTKSCG